jgi:hypothetical protein
VRLQISWFSTKAKDLRLSSLLERHREAGGLFDLVLSDVVDSEGE